MPRRMDTLERLEATIKQRLGASPDESYVARLSAAGVKAIAKKLGEEAAEAAMAAVLEDDGELVGEAADVLFHLMVLLAHKGIPLSTVLSELERREGTSGLAEKAARGA
jgi:phosphoribosyl-ATP pyrophosphohydrolase